MEAAVERTVAIWFVLLGISHISAPRAWSELFVEWRKLGSSGGIRNALLHAPVAILIVGFHQAYHWPAVIVTVVGWLLLLKAALYLIAPSMLSRTQENLDRGEPWRYRAAGAVLVVLGLLFALLSVRSDS